MLESLICSALSRIDPTDCIHIKCAVQETWGKYARIESSHQFSGSNQQGYGV